MTNMRKGFTMIELIFVIVIIGILAAVAIPKLAGTAQEAKKSNYIAFMGTLNRTIAAAMWADNIRSNAGSIKGIADLDEFKLSYGEVPEGVTAINLAACVTPGNTPVSVATLAIADTGFEAVLNIVCRDGSPTQAPRFGWAADGNETNTTFPL